MKLNFYILFALCFMLVNGASAQGEQAPGYQVCYDNDSIMVAVIVSRDCSIPVRELKPPQCEKDVYGDSVRGGEKGRFAKEIEDMNPCLLKGFKFEKSSDNKSATVNVVYDEMPDYASLILYCAKFVPKQGYCTDTFFPVVIIKDKGKGGFSPFSPKASTDNDDTGNANPEINKKNHNMPFICTFLLVTFIVFLLIGCILYKNSKRRRVSNENSRNGIPKATKKSSQKKEKNGQSQLLNDQQFQPLFQMNNAVTNFLRSEEGKRLINNNLSQLLNGQQSQSLSQMNKSVTEFLGSDDGKRLLKDALSQLLNNQQSQQSLSPIPTSAMNTDDVKYDFYDNSFSLEKPEMRIFRIFSDKGNYYYTIVEDIEIRKELASMLNSFVKCITSQPSDGPADRIEPVKPGELIKEGDKFRVDVNNKLVVRFL